MLSANGRLDHTTVVNALHSGAALRRPAVVVAAHPDDETIAMGGRLHLMEHLTVIQLTDGSPRARDDARRAGYASGQAYAAAREREAILALRCLGVMPRRRIRYEARDQEAVEAFAGITESLARDLRGAGLVITHPYEGGHPDHDTAACAVQLACDRIARAGERPPIRLEFASYHAHDGKLCAGRFWPDRQCSELAVRLCGDLRARKRAALKCYRTQSAVIAWFDPDVEHYRPAPRYDFTLPPPPGTSLYDSFGWRLTSSQWRAKVATADAAASLA